MYAGLDPRGIVLCHCGHSEKISRRRAGALDRAHVITAPHRGWHAAHVTPIRHWERAELPLARAYITEQAPLTRLLSREPVKDTSLEYPDRDGDVLARSYAEPRGLDPLRPETKIVVRTPERLADTCRELRRHMASAWGI